MIDAPCMEQWSEDMDSKITLVSELLSDWMKHLEINAGTGGGGVGARIPEIAAF